MTQSDRVVVPLTTAVLLALEGIGWSGDLDEMRDHRSVQSVDD